VRANVYPVPDPDLPFLGLHLTRDLGGDLLIGPTALMVPARRRGAGLPETARDLRDTIAWPGTWRLAAAHRRAAWIELRLALSQREVERAARRLVPDLDLSAAEAAAPGIRAQALGRDGRLIDDFVVHRSERAVHVRNAPSPAATSALALARLIADEADSL
jgi:2-hydroxyglutarate dehydrogenase